MSLRIGLDVDGVLADFTNGFEELIVRITGKDLFSKRGTPQVWDWPEAAGYSREEMQKVWGFVKSSDSFWSSLQPLSDIKFIQPLMASEHDVYFITARPGINAKLQTELWLFLRTGIWPTVLLSDKKGDIARGLDLDVYVDDRAENCINVNLKSPKTRVYIPLRDYNLENLEVCKFEEGRGVSVRVPGLLEVFNAEKLPMELLEAA